MRRPNSNKYVPVRETKAWLYWHECAICGVRFKFEPGYEIITPLRLSQPTEEEKEMGIRWRYVDPVTQSVCACCGKRLLGANPFMITPSEFQDRLFKLHDGPRIEEQTELDKIHSNMQPGVLQRPKEAMSKI
ncbi:MAG: hypothetical protein JHC28_03375 [Thermoprotei archaeon]|nr:hypothetical protein [Thermoprotei archaeon]